MRTATQFTIARSLALEPGLIEKTNTWIENLAIKNSLGDGRYLDILSTRITSNRAKISLMRRGRAAAEEG
jgi:hypothetical protein